jgi:hypothetical protein
MPALRAQAIAPAALTAAICLGLSASGPCTSRQNPACQKQRLPPPAKTTLSNLGRSGPGMIPTRRVIHEVMEAEGELQTLDRVRGPVDGGLLLSHR